MIVENVEFFQVPHLRYTGGDGGERVLVGIQAFEVHQGTQKVFKSCELVV